MKLVSNGISVYSCHTPFDKVRGGNNDIIAERLGLSSVKNLRGDDVVSPSKMAENRDEADIGRTGRFRKPLTYMQAIELAANQLNMSIRQLRACRRSEYGDKHRSGYAPEPERIWLKWLQMQDVSSS